MSFTKPLCVGGCCLCFSKKTTFLFHFLFIQLLWADEFRKMGLSVLDGIKANGLKPRETFPRLQLLKSCDGVEEGPTLTVRLMRSEMPQVGLAARTMVTVIGWAPQFLRESSETEESTPLLRHSGLVGLGWACKSVFLMFSGGSEAAILLAFPALPTSVLGLMLKNPSSNANSGSYACLVIPKP